jgi:hypothetical protein
MVFKVKFFYFNNIIIRSSMNRAGVTLSIKMLYKVINPFYIIIKLTVGFFLP